MSFVNHLEMSTYNTFAIINNHVQKLLIRFNSYLEQFFFSLRSDNIIFISLFLTLLYIFDIK
jgi:hypothetical protein